MIDIDNNWFHFSIVSDWTGQFGVWLFPGRKTSDDRPNKYVQALTGKNNCCKERIDLVLAVRNFMLTLPLLTFMGWVGLAGSIGMRKLKWVPVALPEASQRLYLDIKRLGLPSRASTSIMILSDDNQLSGYTIGTTRIEVTTYSFYSAEYGDVQGLTQWSVPCT